MEANAEQMVSELRKLANPKDAEFLQGFFKTAKGQYGEGDIFLGVRVPQTRKLVKNFRGTELETILELLKSEYHEARLLALLMMVDLFHRSEANLPEAIYRSYMSHTSYINNWDLVDSSAHKIAGVWLLNRSHTPLIRFAKSSDLWKKRIAIMSTLHFINYDRYETTLWIADMLLEDDHDLIHKAVGWMLREIGNRNLAAEEAFLKSRYKRMPRMMLRYSIEKFEESKRQDYLKGRI